MQDLMPIAIYERKVTTIGSTIISERSRAISTSPADDDRFGSVVIPGFTSGFNTARQFNGNESFVKFRGASHAVVYSDLRPRQKFLRSCDVITLTVDGASEEK